MIIKRIQLKDITTHENTVIDFQEGLNVLAGNNGTGKSTVLKMIGYNLFDYLPGNKNANYIRSVNPPPKSGNIKIWIIGKDDQEYLIDRKIGKKKSIYQITDVNTGLEILETGSGKEQLHDWLKEQNNLEKSYELETLFDTCIGVQQGSFTEPFLRRPSDRKKYFSEILNTDLYDKVYKNSIGVFRELERSFDGIKNQVETLSVRLEQKEEKEEKLKKLKIDLEEKIKSKLTADAKYKLQDEKYKNLKQFKKDLDSAESKINENHVRIESNAVLIVKNQKELDASKIAKQICTETKEDYEKFELLRNEVNKLEKKLEKVREAKDNLAKMQGDIKSLEGKIETNTNQIEEIKRISEQLPVLTEKFNQFNELQDAIEAVQKEANELEELLKQKSNFMNEIKDYKHDNENLKIKLSNIDGIRKLVSELGELEKKIVGLEKDESKLQGELHQLIENKDLSKGGNCPFLHEKCKNITGESLEEYFKEKIEEIEKEVSIQKVTLDKLKQKREKIEKKEIELKELEKLEVVLAENQKQLKKVTKELTDIKLKIEKLDGIDKKLNELEEIKKKLEPDMKKYNFIQCKVDRDLPDHQNKIKELNKKKEILQTNLKPLEKFIDESVGLTEKIEDIKKEREKLRENYNKYQQNHKLMEKYEKLIQDQNELFEKKKELEKYEKEIKSLLMELKEKFDLKEFNEIEKKRESLMKIISEIDAKIESAQNQQKELENDIIKLKAFEKERKILLKEQKQLEQSMSFCKMIRIWFKEAGTLMTEALINQINQLASSLYHDIVDNNSIDLEWLADYDVKITTPQNEKSFSQLSGGEQMSAALAIRLAILKVLTNSDFAFFDEPTTNLDLEKRQNLAKCIHNIQSSKGFKQLFVISHDDTFEENADFVVRFIKDENEKTEVEYMT